MIKIRLFVRLLQAAALAAVPAAALRSTPAAAQTPATAFVDISVVAMDTDRVLPHQTVVVRDGKIVAMGPLGGVAVPAHGRRIDGRGKFLMPGLADMHTHLAYAGSQVRDAIKKSETFRIASAERLLLLSLAAGVTTVRNMDFMGAGEKLYDRWPILDGPALLRLKARAASGELWGPRIYTSSKWRRDSTKSVDANVAAYKAAGYDHLKIYYEYGDSLRLDSLVRAAHRLGVPVVGHGVESDTSMRRTLALGLRSIEHMVPYMRNDSALFQAQITARARRAGVWDCPFPSIWYVNTQASRLERRYGLRETLVSVGVRPSELDTAQVALFSGGPFVPSVDDRSMASGQDRAVAALHRGGVPLLLGTDMPLGGIRAGIMVQRNLQSLVRAGLTPYEALLTGTRNVAAYFGILDSAGTVAVGKRADLVVLNGDPLADIRHASDVAGVMVGGRWHTRATLEQRLDAYYRHASR